MGYQRNKHKPAKLKDIKATSYKMQLIRKLTKKTQLNLFVVALGIQNSLIIKDMVC